jgi:hypothetical protein
MIVADGLIFFFILGLAPIVRACVAFVRGLCPSSYTPLIEAPYGDLGVLNPGGRFFSLFGLLPVFRPPDRAAFESLLGPAGPAPPLSRQQSSTVATGAGCPAPQRPPPRVTWTSFFFPGFSS